MDSQLTVALCILSTLLVLSDTIRSGFYMDNGLDQQTVMAEKTLQRHQKKAVKQEILTLLGLHHQPKPLSPTKENSAPRYMMDLYRSLQEDEEDEQETRENNPLFHLNLTLPGMEENIDSADIIMSFVNHARHPDIRHGEGRRFFFDFSEVPAVETVGGAELRIYKASPRWSLRSDTFNLLLYRVVEGVNQIEGSLELETNLTVYAYHQGWLDLNVTRAASLWTQYPPSNHGLYMYIKDEHGDDLDPSDVGLVDFTDAEDKQTFLVAFFKATQKVNSRQRRSTSRRQAKEDVTYNDGPGWGAPAVDRYSKRACQRRALYVNFRDLGWKDWIIAPGGFAAFYCEGECTFPLNAHMNATNHAIVQTLVHLMSQFKAPRPCCAPTKLYAMSVLYFDVNSNVILKKYRNMVVRACGCH